MKTQKIFLLNVFCGLFFLFLVLAEETESKLNQTKSGIERNQN
jgi:hypothetical protein